MLVCVFHCFEVLCECGREKYLCVCEELIPTVFVGVSVVFLCVCVCVLVPGIFRINWAAR